MISVYGYGATETTDFGPLNAAQMVIGLIKDGLFAAAFDVTGTSVCQGDSGGPAIQVIDGLAGIVGVASFNFRGCSTHSASGFVNMQIPGNVEFVHGYSSDVTFL